MDKIVDKNEFLANLQIASPCTANWDEMAGDERSRFCGQCNLHVYNISSMSTREAEEFLRERTGNRVCARFYRRKDGTVLTDDCPVALRKIRDRCKQVAAAAAGLISLVLSVGSAMANPDSTTTPGDKRLKIKGQVRCEGNPAPFKLGRVAPAAIQLKNETPLMGDIAAPIKKNSPAAGVQPEPDWVAMLGKAKRLESANIGYAGTPSTTYQAFQNAWSAGASARPYIDKLLTSGSPAGKLYGAMLLENLDKKAGQEQLKILCKDSSQVEACAGCEVWRATVKELASDIMKGRYFVDPPTK